MQIVTEMLFIILFLFRYATRRKVAGSTPDEVIFKFI
jgi:hypothetical protein